MFIPQPGNNAWSCGWSVVGIYPPSVCQNLAWEELDRLHLCQQSSSSHGFHPPSINLSHPQGQLCGEKSVVPNVLLLGNVQAARSRVGHFLLLRWLSKPCTNSETWESFPWRTLSHLLREAVLTSCHLFLVFPLPFVYFLGCYFIQGTRVGVWMCIVIQMSWQCSTLLSISCPAKACLGKNLWNLLVQFILKSWAFSPIGYG